MAKTDPYRLTDPTGDATPRPVPRGEVARALLWTVLVAGVVANMAASLGGAPTSLHLACGVVTAVAAVALGMRALRGRRQR